MRAVAKDAARLRRDRRGRGLRSELFRGRVPGVTSRAERFEAWLAREAARLRRRFPEELEAVEFAVDQVPPEGSEAVTLGRIYPAHGRTPAHIVVFRRAIETRAADGEDCQDLLVAVLTEQVALLLGIDPEEVG